MNAQNEKRVFLPLNDETVSNLKTGDRVLLNGYVYTARDAAHKRLFSLLEDCDGVEVKKKFPINIKNETIYYVGPTDPKPGEIIGSAGPTSSGRMDKFTPTLLDLGLKGMIGKGRRSNDVINSIKKNKCVYFVCVGGIGALLSKSIIECESVCFEDLGTEGIKRLLLKDFPCIVAIDSSGNNIYENIK